MGQPDYSPLYTPPTFPRSQPSSFVEPCAYCDGTHFTKHRCDSCGAPEALQPALKRFKAGRKKERESRSPAKKLQDDIEYQRVTQMLKDGQEQFGLKPSPPGQARHLFDMK